MEEEPVDHIWIAASLLYSANPSAANPLINRSAIGQNQQGSHLTDKLVVEERIALRDVYVY